MNQLRLLTLVVLLFSACKPAIKPQRSMYYWKTVFQPTEWETSFVRDNKISRLYVKYLDIGWDDATNRPIVLAANQFKNWKTVDREYQSIYKSGNWVPVVFITNATFQHTDTLKASAMALQVYRRLGEMLNSQRPGEPWVSITEIQFDCDWNKASRAAYFSFLRAFSSLAGARCKISATIRLHQYRYPEATGVPPVNAGMLMIYNMINPATPGNKNTIFDEETAESYISRAGKYPLALDIALPAFSWTLCYRAGKLAQIVPEGQLSLANTATFRQINDRKYILLIDTVIGKTYHRTGDIFMHEEINAEILKNGSKIAADMQQHPASLAVYSLNEAQLKKYEKSTFDQIFDRDY